MGVIYKITSPSGRVYIGQTMQDIEKRWKQHVDAAHRVYKDHCKVLNKAIRKYGSKNFTIEILLECSDDELNGKEFEFIKLHNSIVPYGMNIKLGGSSGKHHQSSKDKISNSLKGRIVTSDTRLKLSSTTNPDLPMYVIKVSTNGYRVVNHPMGPEKRFISSKKTDEYNLQRALAYLEKLNELTEPIVVVQSTLEKYIRKHKNGYCVKYPGEKPKYFVSKTILNEDLYKSAQIFLNQLKSKSAVQRLNVSG
jgi:group I intron endonuclease